MNTYYCSFCKKVVFRNSDKKWIKCFCDEAERPARLIKVKERNERL